jgi:hypothetical protein
MKDSVGTFQGVLFTEFVGTGNRQERRKQRSLVKSEKPNRCTCTSCERRRASNYSKYYDSIPFVYSGDGKHRWD